MLASEEGHVDCLRIILKATIHIPGHLDCGDVFGRSCFWLAAQNGNADCLDLLVSHKCLTNLRDHHGKTAVHAAAHSVENEEALRFICAIRGIDIDLPDAFGRTPLDIAPANSVCAEILQEAGAKPTADDEQAEDLRHAAMHHDNETLARLLEVSECRGIIDTPDPRFDDWRMRGYTATQYAAVAGNAKGLLLLIEHGASIDSAGDDEGNSALLLACIRGKAQVVRELLRGPQAGKTNINIVNKAGQGAVFCAVNCNQKECLALLLTEERMDFNRADEVEQLAPLHVACKNHLEQCAKMLLDAGALVNPRDSNGNTPLMYCAQDSLKKLLRSRGGL